MKTCLLWLLTALAVLAADTNAPQISTRGKTVFVLPVRDDIAPPMLYVVRRGVKEAISAQADLLVIDMKTDGGRIDSTEDIIGVLGEFKGETVTFVNDRAFSAGAFIAVATRKIFMAPQSVIGAAAPVMLSPEGGVKDIPEVYRAKMTSAVRALVRRVAEKNGHNTAVVEAMIDVNKELILDGVTLNKKGDLLTLTDTEAAKTYGKPPVPLLSSGTVKDVDALLDRLGYAQARRVEVKPTGAERLGSWLNTISPLLLMIGAIALYIEFKTPGFGAPGIIGIAAFALYFLGGYIAGFSGLEWLLVFIVGAVLLALELFVFPGTIALGVCGGLLMLAAVVMALIDFYPGVPVTPGLPALPRFAAPTAESLTRALQVLLIATVGSAAAIWALARYLPKTSVYSTLVSQGASGVATTAAYEQQEKAWLGQTGVTLSVLRPGGKARFGETILDVMSQGEMIGRDAMVRVIDHRGGTAVVEVVS